MLSRPTPTRDRLAEASGKVRQWVNYIDDIEVKITQQERAFLKTASAALAEAEAAIAEARRQNPTKEQRALHTLLGDGRAVGKTVEGAEAAFAALRAEHDSRWAELSLAKREGDRIRNSDLASALRARDSAIASVLVEENLVAGLVERYAETRRELGRLYQAILALPISCRPQGHWETPIALGELQAGNRSLAVEIADAVAALETNASAVLPEGRLECPKPWL
jgi:hypothetical protein